MEQYLELISIPSIVIFVYLTIDILKSIVGDREGFKRFIPLLAAALGMLAGLISYLFIPQVVPTDNIFMAIIIGAASGLTATGTNQIVKQLLKKDEG